MLAGVLDVRDLAYRGFGNPRRIDDLIAACALEADAPDTRHAFLPPRVLVVIAPGLDVRTVAIRRAWLAECAHLVLVLDQRGDDGTRAPDADWRAALPPGVPVEIVPWVAGDAAACRGALDRAIRLAATLPEQPPPPPVAVPDLELPPGPWIDCDEDYPPILMRLLSAGLHGTTLETSAGDVELTALPSRVGLVVRREGPYPLARDPVHPVQWEGERMYAGLRYGDGELGALDHDYPCGPAKKLWGFSSNNALDAAMSPEADLAVVHFSHDVLVTSRIPIRWSAMRGPDGAVVEVARFERDVERCVLFARDPGVEHYTDDLRDEDAREHAPCAMLAGEQRYAVDFALDTYRLTADDVEPIGESGSGFGVFDRDHRLVRTGTGELLGGWHRHATIIDGDFVWREDLVTGVRRAVVPTDFRTCADPEIEAIARDAMREGRFDRAAQIHAEHPAATDGEARVIAVPGTRNILYIVRGRFRVI